MAVIVPASVDVRIQGNFFLKRKWHKLESRRSIIAVCSA